MPKRSALYREKRRRQRVASVEVESERVLVNAEGEEPLIIFLDGATFLERDATSNGRFVQELHIRNRAYEWHFITPPQVGTIAPRASRVPPANDDAIVLSKSAWDALALWLRGGATLSGRNLDDLLLLSAIATRRFAMAIGEQLARIVCALELQTGPPQRRTDPGEWLLTRFRVQATHCPRTADVVLTAIAIASSRRRY